MSALIRGDLLPPDLRAEVLRRYVNRWTHENATAANVRLARRVLAERGVIPAPLISDADWLKAYGFWVTKRGTLDKRKRYCEPIHLRAMTDRGAD